MNPSHSHSSHSKRTLTQRLAGKRSLLIPAALVILSALGGGTYYFTREQASPEDRIELAKQMELAGDRKGASIVIKNALQQIPNNGEARFLMGRIHHADNDFLNAEKELRQAIKKGYPSPEAPILLARTLLALHQPKALLDDINVIPGATAPSNATILALRAHAYALTGDKDSMENSLRHADEQADENPDTLAVRAGQAYANGQAEQALALVDKAIAKAGGRVDLQVMKGDLLRALKRSKEAFEAYTFALKIDPSNLAARLALVQSYLATAELDKAQAEIITLKRFAPNNLKGRYFEGLIDFRRKNLEEANIKLQEVLRSAPDFAPANLLVGAISLSQGKRESAITHLNRVLEAAPDHILARKLLAATMLEAGQTERARELIAKIKNDDKDAQLLSLQGNLAMRQGAYQEARGKFEMASELAPDNTALIRELAASRMATGDEAGAVKALAEMAEKDTTSHQADVLLVITHGKARRYDEALKVVDALDHRQPGLPLAENLRGSIFLLRNNHTLARQHFSKALEIDAGYLPAASNLARLDLINKDIKSARARIQGVLKKYPRNSRAIIILAELALFEKDEPEYLRLLEQAKKAAPTETAAWHLSARYWLNKREPGKALLEARSALASTGQNEFLSYVGAAQSMQGDAASALASYSKWAESNPTNPEAWIRRAQAQNHTKDYKAAIISLDKALALRPNNIEASLSKSLLLNIDGRPEDALKIARAIQVANPRNAAGFYAEAEVLLTNKKPADAARLFSKAAQLSGNSAFYINAYKSYIASGQDSEGANVLLQHLRKKPEDKLVKHQLAQHYLSNKRLKEAANEYSELIRSNPKDVIAYNNLAWIQGELGSPEALANAEQAYKLSPESIATMDTFGWLLVKSGQKQRGLDLLKRALAKSPDATEIHWHFAAALAQTGDRSRAKQELQSLLDMGKAFPQEAEARRLMDSLK